MDRKGHTFFIAVYRLCAGQFKYIQPCLQAYVFIQRSKAKHLAFRNTLQKRCSVHNLFCSKKKKMEETGRCYCGELRYSVRGSLEGSLQGHCRECQYITVGNPNVAVVFALEDFKFTEGLSAKLVQSDLETPVVRHFCANSGTGTGSRSPALPNSMLAKVDTFNNQSFFTTVGYLQLR